MFTQLAVSHQNPEVTCSLLTPLLLPPLTFNQRFLFAGTFFFFFLVRKGLWSDWMLIVHCYPLLALYSSLSLSALLHIQPSPSSALPFSPPSPALASNGLNRLAPCQSRGLLWLCHKSARKNRNHLFRPGPERGWGCKYMSLALALGPACAHRTTEPQWRIPALPLSLNLHSHQLLFCNPQQFHC